MTVTFSEEQVHALMGMSQKNNPHGTLGLFGTNVEPSMPWAIPLPETLATKLDIVPSNNVNAIVETFTSQTVASGENAANACDVSSLPTPGLLAVCRQITPYGEFMAKTQELNATDSNVRTSVADINRTLRNNPMRATSPLIPAPPNGVLDVNSLWGKASMAFGRFASLAFSHVAIQGSKANTGAGARLGFITEFDGIDQLIKTGYVDSITSTACPAADSYVNSTGGALDATRMGYIIDAYRTLKLRATQVAMPGVEWAIVLSPTMRDLIFDTWACNFATVKCINTANMRYDGYATAELRDMMKSGSYVMIDGEEVPVIFDDGVAYTVNSTTGVYTSDVYIVPLRWMGTPLTYMEYQPFRLGSQVPDDLAAFQSVYGHEIEFVNNGFYIGGMVRSGAFCVSRVFFNRTRLRMDYPFLAARVDDITYTPTITYRDPDSFAGGGVTGATTAR